MSALRDEYGDLPRYQDHELPHQDHDKTHLARPFIPGALEAAARAWSEDVWQERHEECEASWECESCGRRVCPRCEPSPAEFRLCDTCSWFDGGAA